MAKLNNKTRKYWFSLDGLEEVRLLAKKCKTSEQLAKKMNISENTLYKYKKENQEFNKATGINSTLEVLKTDFNTEKNNKINEVNDALYKIALGYDYTETKENAEGVIYETSIKHQAPSVSAIKMILTRDGEIKKPIKKEQQTKKPTSLNI